MGGGRARLRAMAVMGGGGSVGLETERGNEGCGGAPLGPDERGKAGQHVPQATSACLLTEKAAALLCVQWRCLPGKGAAGGGARTDGCCLPCLSERKQRHLLSHPHPRTSSGAPGGTGLPLRSLPPSRLRRIWCRTAASFRHPLDKASFLSRMMPLE